MDGNPNDPQIQIQILKQGLEQADIVNGQLIRAMHEAIEAIQQQKPDQAVACLKKALGETDENDD